MRKLTASQIFCLDGLTNFFFKLLLLLTYSIACSILPGFDKWKLPVCSMEHWRDLCLQENWLGLTRKQWGKCNDWYLFVHRHYTVQGSNQRVRLKRELNIGANMRSAPRRLILATCEEIKQWNRKDMSLFRLWLTFPRMPFLPNNHEGTFISAGWIRHR